ncbi:MAG: Lrp/AsnC family transcriptional regulator [Alistipes sp.]|nr:Lrp/AsnC family transcriptional regulator [Alistipes sp.]MBQ3208343.1 Lrp/AsnC family transcriptional regulator [Alistipes sp.]MBQ6869351.1 Lrp/AsnC family transcriptional regulator [Alistipes sp.]MBQ7952304.1 Lrp/AsnC family transcriptional regulator [Alistipes sp.]MBQ9962653.1 Lrp/AsnC family transcriptional regulator [Alistipes sp.]
MSNHKIALDATDRKILKFLVKNARMPYLEIARECGISGAAIHQRIKKLEESGIIMGSRMMVNPKMLGFDVCAFISIRIQDPIMSHAVAEKIKSIPEVVECHFITGTYNAMLKLYCVDNDHLMKTIFDGILRVPGISTTQTYISLNEAFQREPHIDYLDKLPYR